jgi:IS30 family transposase
MLGSIMLHCSNRYVAYQLGKQPSTAEKEGKRLIKNIDFYLVGYRNWQAERSRADR